VVEADVFAFAAAVTAAAADATNTVSLASTARISVYDVCAANAFVTAAVAELAAELALEAAAEVASVPTFAAAEATVLAFVAAAAANVFCAVRAVDAATPSEAASKNPSRSKKYCAINSINRSPIRHTTTCSICYGV
jgi:hypothetical protein